jgi:hypothetical protein
LRADVAPSCPCPLLASPQKYWADNTRPYRYVTSQTIRASFWKSEASEAQRALLAAPPSLDGGASSSSDAGSDEERQQALTTQT